MRKELGHHATQDSHHNRVSKLGYIAAMNTLVTLPKQIFTLLSYLDGRRRQSVGSIQEGIGLKKNRP